MGRADEHHSRNSVFSCVWPGHTDHAEVARLSGWPWKPDKLSIGFVNLWQMISNGTAEQAIAKVRGEDADREQVAQSEPDDREEPVRH